MIGTASTGNHDRLAALGAEPVEYGDGLTGRVRELAPEGVDVVADFVGGVLDVTTAVLAQGGVHASIADPDVLGAGGEWIWVRPDGQALAELRDLARRGSLQVPVAQVFPLHRLAEAYQLSSQGHVPGKIAVEVTTG